MTHVCSLNHSAVETNNHRTLHADQQITQESMGPDKNICWWYADLPPPIHDLH